MPAELVKVYDKKTGKLLYQGTKHNASVFIHRSNKYLSQRIYEGIYENKDYRWELITSEQILEKRKDYYQGTKFPAYIIRSLDKYGNTIISNKEVKRLGGKEKVLDILESLGFHCTIQKAEPMIRLNGQIVSKHIYAHHVIKEIAYGR